ncbi:trypsin-like peptidase domain-containing protein [Yinghuangia sp. ASG 101]|uniref:S1C family serine protease n=1 Tax=Yinghuangia sp. ASG 101 TaxID=2896848 RepID=UPI001E53DFCE|nr:trypsin-like peptidase domain-containing protein [Yinghuangia sp. ASG 101]UGQ14954.1 trypsin-like peptidase domain-containing protein [Yinghuangia sp. ASG 101]
MTPVASGARWARGRRAVAVCAVVLALACGGVACSDDGGGDNRGSTAVGTPSAPSVPGIAAVEPPGPARDLEDAYHKVVVNVLPSVVQITTDDGLGSGIVYDNAGNIVTNAHVVGSATQFQVTLATGAQPVSAHLVAAYPPNDVAVIRLDNPPSDLRPASWGDSSALDVGTIVLAMGNPLGLSGSVSEGIVSALGRTQSESADGGGSSAVTIPNLIQTTAAINPGNSGGALVDLNGSVVGIPTLAAASGPNTPAPGIGFAIPSNTAKNLADQMIRDGRVTDSNRAALGITATTVVGRQGGTQGVGVVTVNPDSGAAHAGIQPGDVITAVNGTPTPTQSALSELLAGLKPGDVAKVDLLRADGSTATVDVTLGELP